MSEEMTRLLKELDRIAGGIEYEGGTHSIMFVSQAEARAIAAQIRHEFELAWQYRSVSN